jgi:alkaline phosphatase D
MMATRITRRQALVGASLALLLPMAHSRAAAPKSKAHTVFAHGVASGDPDQTSVVLWTRVSGSQDSVTCRWLVATDNEFLNVVASGNKQTDAALDHTVKVVVEGLRPGQQYYYKFEHPKAISTIGRTRTLPVGHVESLNLAVVTCSNYAFGYFNAYEVIANDPDVDLVLHLGDYIYEHGIDAYGGDVGQRIGRSHKPTHEIISLADYRQRHAQYKTDPCSQAMHAQHPMIVIWDDHESTNNPWMGGAANHQPNEGSWTKRRADSLQAYYEWLPIREPKSGNTRLEYWRHYKFGDLASLITLESRHTGRSKQIEYKDYQEDLNTVDEALAFRQKVLGNPERTMLSDKMEAFLTTELAESVHAKRRWRMIGNQSVMAKAISPKLNAPYFEQLKTNLDAAASRRLGELTRLGELELPDDLDTWEGYSVARERFYQIAKDADASDLLVLSGDSHSYWQNQLFDANNKAMGVELGATGITSPRSLLAFGEEGLRHFDEANAANNKEIVWADGRHRGFIRLNINHQRVQADYIIVSTVESRQYTTETIRSVDITKAGNSLAFT